MYKFGQIRVVDEHLMNERAHDALNLSRIELIRFLIK